MKYILKSKKLSIFQNVYFILSQGARLAIVLSYGLVTELRSCKNLSELPDFWYLMQDFSKNKQAIFVKLLEIVVYTFVVE